MEILTPGHELPHHTMDRSFPQDEIVPKRARRARVFVATEDADGNVAWQRRTDIVGVRIEVTTRWPENLPTEEDPWRANLGVMTYGLMPDPDGRGGRRGDTVVWTERGGSATIVATVIDGAIWVGSALVRRALELQYCPDGVDEIVRGHADPDQLLADNARDESAEEVGLCNEVVQLPGVTVNMNTAWLRFIPQPDGGRGGVQFFVMWVDPALLEREGNGYKLRPDVIKPKAPKFAGMAEKIGALRFKPILQSGLSSDGFTAVALWRLVADTLAKGKATFQLTAPAELPATPTNPAG